MKIIISFYEKNTKDINLLLPMWYKWLLNKFIAKNIINSFLKKNTHDKESDISNGEVFKWRHHKKKIIVFNKSAAPLFE